MDYVINPNKIPNYDNLDTTATRPRLRFKVVKWVWLVDG